MFLLALDLFHHRDFCTGITINSLTTFSNLLHGFPVFSSLVQCASWFCPFVSTITMMTLHIAGSQFSWSVSCYHCYGHSALNGCVKISSLTMGVLRYFRSFFENNNQPLWWLSVECWGPYFVIFGSDQTKEVTAIHKVELELQSFCRQHCRLSILESKLQWDKQACLSFCHIPMIKSLR